MSSAHCLHSNMHCMLCWVLTIHCFQVERLSASILNILEAGCMHSSAMQLMFYFYSPENFGPVSRLDLRRNGQMGDITAFLCCCPTAQATWCLGVIGSPLSGWRVKFSPSTPGFTQNITTGACPLDPCGTCVDFPEDLFFAAAATRAKIVCLNHRLMTEEPLSCRFGVLAVSVSKCFRQRGTTISWPLRAANLRSKNPSIAFACA
jgi:hypothetical protein